MPHSLHLSIATFPVPLDQELVGVRNGGESTLFNQRIRSMMSTNLQSTGRVFSMRIMLTAFYHSFLLSSFIVDVCAAEQWNAKSTPIKWHYTAETDDAISSEGLVDFETDATQNKGIVNFAHKSGGVCEGAGSGNRGVAYSESENKQPAPGAAAAPANIVARPAAQEAPTASPTPLRKGSWQAALMDMLPSTNAGKDGGRVTGIRLDETPRTIADYGGAAEIGFADQQNVSVFLFRAPRKGQSDAWVVSTISDLSPVTKGKSGFEFSWHKVDKLDGACLRVANGAGQVNVVCGIYDVELPLLMTVSGSYSGKQEDKIPLAILQRLYDRLFSARNLILDTVYDL